MNPHIERALGAFNNHDVDGVVAEFADGGTFFDPPQDEELTRDELRAYFEEVFEAFPDVRVEEERVLTTPDGAVAIEWTMHGTHEGPFEGIPPTGETIALPGVSIVTASDDGITTWRDYWDRRTLAGQLGLE